MTLSLDGPRLSPSLAKILVDPKKTPLHAWHGTRQLAGEQIKSQTRSAETGKAIDAFVFGTAKVNVKHSGKQKAEPGEILLWDNQYDECRVAADRIIEFLRWQGIQPSVENAQRHLDWTSSGGVNCKGTPDYIDFDNRLIVDLKTSYALDDESVIETIERYRYDIQAAAYLEAMNTLYGSAIPWRFRFVFSESASPFLCRWVVLSDLRLNRGATDWSKAGAKWQELLQTNAWEGYKPLYVE